MSSEEIVLRFLATLFGVLLGIPVALWVDRKTKERSKYEKAVSVLSAIKEELNHNVRLLKQIQDELNPNSMIYYNMDMNTWRASSLEEFEGLIKYELLRKIFRIYYEYELMSRKVDTQFSMHYSVVRTTKKYPHERAQIVAAILTHAKNLEKESTELVEEIESELTRMTKKKHKKGVSGFSWKYFTAILVAWIALIILMDNQEYISGMFEPKIKPFFIYGYMAVASLSLTKFLEKRRIVEKFGLERNNLLAILVAIYIALVIVYYFEIKNITGVFLAPLIEELFFRGHILGTLAKRDYTNWKGIIGDSWWIIFTSILFAISHLFIEDYSVSSMILVLIGGIPLGILYVRFKTILWCFIGHMSYNLSLVFELPLLSFSILLILSAIIVGIGYIKRSQKEAENIK